MVLISASLTETNRVISQQSVKTLTAGSHCSCSMFTWFSYLSNWESKKIYIFCLGTFMPLQLNGPWINIHTNSIVWATEPGWGTFRPVHLTSHNMANNSLGCCSAANTRCCHQSGLVLICNETSSFSTSLGLMYGDGGGRPSSVMSLGVTSVGGHSHGHPASPIGVGSSWEDIDPRSPEPLVVRGGWLWLIWVVRWTT